MDGGGGGGGCLAAAADPHREAIKDIRKRVDVLPPDPKEDDNDSDKPRPRRYLNHDTSSDY